LNTAIEVDGPSHFENIWGEAILRKNQIRDYEKNGLLLQQGFVIIRIQQTRSLSEKYKRDTLATVIETLEKIRKKKPAKGLTYIS
jgi:very-short-patch-repair endonuclease